MRTRTPLAAPELKFTPLDLKAVDADGTFEGYASLFDKEDLGHDVVAARRLPRQPARARRRRHQDAVPARPRRAHRRLGAARGGRARPLRPRPPDARGRPRARGARPHARRRARRPLHRLPRRQGPPRPRKTGVRRLEKVDLWEISIVTFPLLPEARVAHVKARPFAQRRTHGTRIRTLAHAGRWAHALAGPRGHPRRPQGPHHAGRCSRPSPRRRLVAQIEEATRLLR